MIDAKKAVKKAFPISQAGQKVIYVSCLHLFIAKNYFPYK